MKSMYSYIAEFWKSDEIDKLMWERLQKWRRSQRLLE